MKRLTTLAAAISVVVGAASTAWAGQEIYVGVVGYDIDMKRYYLEEKLWRWLHPEQTGYEHFQTVNTSDNPEVCINENGDLDSDSYAPNQHLPVFNIGSYHWRINIPKKPRGNINIQLQCGVLKPNSYEVLGMPNAIDTCAGETGEDTFGLCDRVFTQPNQNHIKQGYLPTVKVMAHSTNSANAGDGPTFPMTAYRVPSAFSNISTATGALKGYSKNLQVLDGSKGTRMVLKSCQPETIFAKMPITGQMVAAKADDGTVTVHKEHDLEAGDELEVWLEFPRGHTMDVYCNQFSAKLMGLGDPATEDDVED